MRHSYVLAHLKLPQNWDTFNGFLHMGMMITDAEEVFQNLRVHEFFEWLDREIDYVANWDRGPSNVMTYEHLHLFTITVPDDDAAFLIRMRWGFVGIREGEAIPWDFAAIDPRTIIQVAG